MEKLVRLKIDQVELEGMLEIPEEAKGIVLFSHGSGSSRHSPRNNYVAKVLRDAKIGTLLIDLLTEQEDAVYETRFNIDLLTQRLTEITRWLQNQPDSRNFKIGLFGASTGAASALRVAAALGQEIAAVVSRGGRVDMAMPVMGKIVSPTLFIVGERDFEVAGLNKDAFDKLVCEKQMSLVKDATHLFEETGTLEEVAKIASEWFVKYFSL